MIPKIEFRYSPVYDNKFKKAENSPKGKEVISYMQRMEREWNKHSERILKAISRISGLKWREKKIICYLVLGNTSSFSDPLTMKIWRKGKYKRKTRFVDILTHELIHNIFIQNKCKKAHVKTVKKYLREDKATVYHILLHAIHKEIYLTILNRNRLIQDKRKCKTYPAYDRAWQIVEEEGHLNLIKQFKKELKK